MLSAADLLEFGPVRFALYSAQELAAASESLLVDSFGD